MVRVSVPSQSEPSAITVTMKSEHKSERSRDWELIYWGDFFVLLGKLSILTFFWRSQLHLIYTQIEVLFYFVN